MSERVPHSRTGSWQRVAREIFVNARDFVARQQFGHDGESLFLYLSRWHLRFAPNLKLMVDASYADEDDADED
jgi:hypothetical protein